MNPSEIAILINSLVVLLSIVVAILTIRFVPVENKGYKLLFVLYILFWIPLMMCRQYTGTIAKEIVSPDKLNYYDYRMWLPMCAYGFIGIFWRPFADWFSYKRMNRKNIIYLALMISAITYIPFCCVQNLATNIIQSLGVGIGASMIGTYQLMFNEQYGKAKTFLTVSMLSIPPLIGDFISSSIQSVVTSIGSGGLQTYRWFWIIGLIITVIAFVLAFFVKENKKLMYQDNKYKMPIKTKNEWIYFVWICVLGSLIAFIRWANSGSIAQVSLQFYAQHLDGNLDKYSLYQGYLSLIFSFAQLFGGLITGLLLVNKIGKMWTFTIGCSCWIIYELLGTYIVNPYAYMGIHLLNGFSYGIVYNMILGFVLQRRFNTKKQSPMGIYQAVISLGIMVSNFYTGWLKSGPYGIGDFNEFKKVSQIVNWVVIAAIAVAWLVFMYTWLIEKWNYKHLWFHKKSNKKYT